MTAEHDRGSVLIFVGSSGMRRPQRQRVRLPEWRSGENAEPGRERIESSDSRCRVRPAYLKRQAIDGEQPRGTFYKVVLHRAAYCSQDGDIVGLAVRNACSEALLLEECVLL